MRGLFVIPVLLLITIRLSLSDVFPISVDQTDADPRQLDQQQKNSYEFSGFENIPIDYDYYEKRTSGNQHIIIKIRKICLAFLTNSKKNINSNIKDYWNLVQRDSIDLNKLYAKRDEEDQNLLTNKLNSLLNTTKAMGGKLKKKDLSFLETDPEEKKTVKKRFFSELSRLKGFSRTEDEINEIKNRRHQFIGRAHKSNSTSTTSESWIRSLGVPLRWG